MRRVALIYNPASGQRPERRAAQIAEVEAVFRGAGVEVQVIETEASASAGAQALEAVQDGCDTIVACGGDGTVHEALQGLVGGSAALGVIPMGTANALAADLGVPASPKRAAQLLLDATPVRISVGHLFYHNSKGKERSRYFVVAAGVGVDALFFSRLDSRLKQRFGYAAYLVEAFRMWAQHDFPFFGATLTESGTGIPRTGEMSQLLAIRISDFGGLVRKLAPGASIRNETLSVIAFRTRSKLRYLRFMLTVMLRRHTFSDVIEMADCQSVECCDLEGASAPTFVEADGELLGRLPARIEVVPQSLTLLIPQKTLSRIRHG
ncbi:MAG TPA: YegS/Rv2252/BmrU family lipid kinase [Acidobacteriaceae bacterium]|jgi:YegS/Rv2252/BmrU family lipid kinase